MEIISGGISGAITNPYSDEAEKHAEMYYREIKAFSTDVEKIANNTGFSKDQILLVKNYLFVWEHNLGGEAKCFDPCFEIAESWRRMAFDPKNIQPHDLTLLRHELMEIGLVGQGHSQSSAHDIASEKFNYAQESKAFYEALGYKEKTNKPKNGGGIKKKISWEERC